MKKLVYAGVPAVALFATVPAWAAALTFTITDITGTIDNVATAVATIGAALVAVTIAVKGWRMIRGGI